MFTPINRLCRVDGSWFKTKTVNFSFYEDSTSGKTVAMAMALSVSLCFFCDAHLWSQVSRTLLRYFQRYCLFSILPFLVANNMISSKWQRIGSTLEANIKTVSFFFFFHTPRRPFTVYMLEKSQFQENKYFLLTLYFIFAGDLKTLQWHSS